MSDVRGEDRVGSTVRGKYRVDRLIGFGGMAIVYAVTHRNNKRFAMKMLHPELSLVEGMRQRFLREGYVANTVDHPGAVAVVDDDVAEDGSAYLVMELLEGVSVEEAWERSGCRLPIAVVLHIADSALATLEAAHQKGIVHRDLKPANLFLTQDGSVKILDFGIARLQQKDGSGVQTTQPGVAMGTPAFMPPEQALGRTTEIDARTDLWSLGATLFTLVSGDFVHEATNASEMLVATATKPARALREVLPDAPSELAALLDKALAFRREDRFQSAGEMRVAVVEAARMLDMSSSAKLIQSLATTQPNLPRKPPADAFAATATPTPLRPPPRETETVSKPVSTNLAAPHRSKTALWGVLVAGVATVAIVTSIAVSQKMSARAHGDSLPSVSATARTPVTVEAVETVVIATATATVTATATTTPVVHATRTPVATTSAHPLAPASHTATTPSAAPNCATPYTIDETGKRHYKPECL